MRCRKVPGLGERLRDAILSSPYTPTEIEKLTGVNHSFISRYTSEQMVPSVYTIYALAGLLNVSADYLLFGKERR